FGRSFCALADGAVSPITSGIKYFRQEFLDLCTDQTVTDREVAADSALAGAAR
ncbi:MAG: NADH-ubiquinone oxidoreductase-F iron-sulfur binding region domain-containing protein, partial [Mycobacteriaceae bacterium]